MISTSHNASFTFEQPDNPNRYDAIIGLSPPKSKTRTPMPLYDRAAQFSAFKALSGYEDMIAETVSLTLRTIR